MKYIITFFFTLLLLICPITVRADDEIEELDIEELEVIKEVNSSEVDIPNINSRAAIVIERNSKVPIFEKNANEKRKMASTTKIMTAIVVVERCDLSEEVIVSKKAGGIGGSRLGLKAGDKVKVKDLLYGLMLCSGNDAAVALAEHVGGSVEGFANLMNVKAKELGLKDTHFVTPHGLDADEHYTTAYELAILTDYALKIQEIANIVKTKIYTVTISGHSKQVSNTNELLGYLDGVYGVKTGFTNGANRCLVTAVKRDNLDIICVVLGADTKKFRTKDSVKLIEYSFKNYDTISLKEDVLDSFKKWKLLNEKQILVIKGTEEHPLTMLDGISYPVYPLKKEQQNRIKIEIESEKILEAPVDINTKIGELKVKVDEKELFSIDIIIQEEIKKKNVWDYFKQILAMTFRNKKLQEI